MWGIGVGVLVAVGAIVIAASALQGASGFGFALLAVPLISLVLSPKTAVVTVFMTGSFVSFITAWRLRRQIDWPEVLHLSIASSLAMPVGVLILHAASVTLLRVILGVASLLVALWLLRNNEAERAGGPRRLTVTYAAGFASGLLNTSIAANGPPLVMYLRHRRLEADVFRATIALTFSIASVIGMVFLLIGASVHVEAVRLTALSIPLTALGWFVGNLVASRIAREHFARLVDLLLLASGLLVLGRALWS